MRLCIAYPNRSNYSETFIYNHLQYLEPEFTLSGGWRPYLTLDDKNIFNFPLGNLMRVGIKRGFPFLYPEAYNYFLTRYLQKIQPACILAEYGITGVYLLKACQRLNTPLVVHFHGFDASYLPTLKKYSKKYLALFDYAKAIIAVSNDMKAQLVSLGADAQKVNYIPYGVKTEQFFGALPEKSDKTIVAVGRFTAKKAPHLTIKAFKIVVSKIPEAQLFMIGKGELFEECQTLVKTLHLEKSVHLLGVKSPEEVATYLKKARMFVQHSMFSPEGDSEGMPNSILEASSSGLPIVSTRHAGIKDAVEHGVTGFLTEEGDYEQMAQYMVTLLENPELAGEMGRKGRQKMINEYDMPLQIAKLRKIMEQ